MAGTGLRRGTTGTTSSREASSARSPPAEVATGVAHTGVETGIAWPVPGSGTTRAGTSRSRGAPAKGSTTGRGEVSGPLAEGPSAELED